MSSLLEKTDKFTQSSQTLKNFRGLPIESRWTNKKLQSSEGPQLTNCCKKFSLQNSFKFSQMAGRRLQAAFIHFLKERKAMTLLQRFLYTLPTESRSKCSRTPLEC